MRREKAKMRRETAKMDDTLPRSAISGAVWLELDGERVALLPDRAVWWPRTATLFVADVHLGKAATYRAHGVPVPESTTASTLAALSALFDDLDVRRVIWLGDLLHAREAQQPVVLDAVSAWRCRHAAVEMLLVRGNHDAHAGDPPAKLAIPVVDEPYACGPFAACHHPQRVPGMTVLAGHVHPAITLRSAGHQRLRLPCYWWQPRMLILPAFGEFTGGATPVAMRDARVWPVGEGAVWPAIRP